MLGTRLSRIVSLALGLAALSGGIARAELLVYEPFNYAFSGAPDKNGDGKTDLDGQTGTGLGLAGNWVETGPNPRPFDYIVQGQFAGVANTAAWPSPSTNRLHSILNPTKIVQTDNELSRDLSSPLLGSQYPILWFSFLAARTNSAPTEDSDDYFGLAFFTPDQSQLVFAGDPIGDVRWSLDGGVTADPGVAITNNAVTFLVGRITFGTETKVDLFINPAAGPLPPTTLPAATRIFTADGQPFDGIGSVGVIMQGRTAPEFEFDEIRIGTQWSDIAAPEPGTAATLLAGIGILGMIRRRRRA
jgi:hypothetical protein